MAQLAARFSARAEQDCLALREALRKEDRIAVRDLAHRLAGTAPMLGFEAIGEAARTLEDAADSGRPLGTPAENLLSQLERVSGPRD